MSRSRNIQTKRRQNRISYLILLLFLIMFIGIISGGIYSYWAGSITDPTQGTKNRSINIGEAEGVTTTINITENLGSKKLVPQGKAAVSVGGASANVDSYVDTFNVKWSSSSTGITESDNVTGTLTVVATPTLTGADGQDYSSLVSINVSPASTSVILNGSTEVPVTVTATLTEPPTSAVYTQIINQPITADLTFKVVQ